MVYEKFYGRCDCFWGWKCIFCGDIVDQVILENQAGKSQKHSKDG
jgi:hypothetical protein